MLLNSFSPIALLETSVDVTGPFSAALLNPQKGMVHTTRQMQENACVSAPCLLENTFSHGDEIKSQMQKVSVLLGDKRKINWKKEQD